MTRPAQKNWFRREGEPAEQPPASRSDVEPTTMPTKRIAEYALAQEAATSSNVEADTEQGVGAESEPRLQRSTGEEVDAILQTARDTAAKVTKAATEEAERTRAEANAAATRAVEDARHRAETELEQAAKARADAEAYAARLRNEAETAATKLRAEAESEAATLVEAARARLAAADAEVEEKLEAAEESARARVSALHAEARRHEDRLEHLLAVLRGMSLQVETALEGESEDRRGFEPPEEELGEALRPDARSEPVA